MTVTPPEFETLIKQDNPVVWAIIPARGGSKGIPRKNIKLLCGQPLLHYTVESAREAGCIQHLILSTDDEEIAQTGERLGLEVPFLRPASLAADDTPMISVIQYTVQRLIEENKYPVPDIILVLQPTTPLRPAHRIRYAVHKLWSSEADSLITVYEVPHRFSPFYMMKIEDETLHYLLPDAQNVTRRQDVPKAYHNAGEIYAIKTSALFAQNHLYGSKLLPLEIPIEEALTIDILQDWDRAEQLLMAQQQIAVDS